MPSAVTEPVHGTRSRHRDQQSTSSHEAQAIGPLPLRKGLLYICDRQSSEASTARSGIIGPIEAFAVSTSSTPSMSSRASNPSLIRILVADDHAVVRAGLRSLLGRQADMEVVGDAADSAELSARWRELLPDVIVTDLRMPGGGVLDFIRAACAEQRGMGVVVFSAFDDPTDAAQALRAGASGYVLKQAPEANLLTAIRRARAGRRFVDAPIAARIMEESLEPGSRDLLERATLLSDRETAVLNLVSLGYTGRQIATELGLRVGTVESYRHRIRKKLGLRSRAEVTEFARASAKLRDPP